MTRFEAVSNPKWMGYIKEQCDESTGLVWDELFLKKAIELGLTQRDIMFDYTKELHEVQEGDDTEQEAKLLHYLKRSVDARTGYEWREDFLKEALKGLEQREVIEAANILHYIQELNDPKKLDTFILSLRL
nr:hypothetical protein [uncultured Lachnoclostridium sp.]